MSRHDESVLLYIRPAGFASKRFCFILLLAVIPLRAQTAQDFSQVRKVFVDPLNSGTGAKVLQEDLIKRLRKSRTFRVVAAPDQADAILKASGQLWITGYVAASPRTRSRQAVYGGFLSVELAGKNDEILWSYLVTPNKLSWSSVSDDLARSLVKEMVAAHDRKQQAALASPGSNTIEQTALNGACATFPAPLYQKWFESFEQRHPNVQITYDAVGSEAGTSLLAENKVDFAASDVPPSEADSSQQITRLLRIATVLGAVVPIYHLEGLAQDLKFTPETLADIYLGKITRWNDPLIRRSNKSVSLPDAEIVVVHRTDGSGTSYAWSDYLSKTSVEWKRTVGAGTTLHWPVGKGAERNDGVAALVERTPNSIGYVELVYAIQHQLSFGAVQNAAGEYIRADLSSLNAAATAEAGGHAAAASSSITNASGKDAYPIAAFTFLLLTEQATDNRKRAALFELLQWVLTSGQKECSALGYAPLPREIANQQLEVLNRFK